MLYAVLGGRWSCSLNTRALRLHCVQRGLMNFSTGFCSTLTQDNACILAALERAVYDPCAFWVLKSECFEHLEHYCVLLALCIPVKLLISPLLPDTVVTWYTSRVLFSFAQICIRTLLLIPDFLNSKLLSYGIAYGILWCFRGVRLFLCSAECRNPFSSMCGCWSLRHAQKREHGVGNSLKVGFRGSCERLGCGCD